MEDMLEDLSDHIKYHATIGYAECRDFGTGAGAMMFEGDKHFVVQHEGRLFKITIEEENS